MWELDCEESRAPKNWCFWTVVLEKTLESPLDCKEIQPVHPKGSQSWLFIGRSDAEAETPILWPPDVKKWLIGKDPDAGKDWSQEVKGMTADEMAGWHHWLNGHEFNLNFILYSCFTMLLVSAIQQSASDYILELWFSPGICPRVGFLGHISSVPFSHSVVSNSLRPMNRSTPALPCPSPTLEFTQTHVHWVGDAI